MSSELQLKELLYDILIDPFWQLLVVPDVSWKANAAARLTLSATAAHSC